MYIIAQGKRHRVFLPVDFKRYTAPLRVGGVYHIVSPGGEKSFVGRCYGFSVEEASAGSQHRYTLINERDECTFRESYLALCKVRELRPSRFKPDLWCNIAVEP
jgi:hypothetical protein